MLACTVRLASSSRRLPTVQCGRPVLAVPKSAPDFIGRRIAIAWNGSAECARALGGATNFFEQAEAVVILTAHSQRTPVSVVPELEGYLNATGSRWRPESSPAWTANSWGAEFCW